MAGDEWDDSWSDLSVKDTSAKIDYYRNNPPKSRKEQSSNLATEKQLNFIRSNKYYPLPFIDKIKNRLTKDDASLLCSVLTPYTDDVNYYGYRRRMKYEYWFPDMAQTVIEVISKYGLTEEISQLKSELDAINAERQSKIDKANAEREKQYLADANIVFASTKDDAIKGIERAFNVYLHGAVENAMGWDLVNVVPSESNYSLAELLNEQSSSRSRSYSSLYCKVIGYDRPCVFLFWRTFHYSIEPRLTGVILDYSEVEKYREQCEALAKNFKDAGYIVG